MGAGLYRGRGFKTAVSEFLKGQRMLYSRAGCVLWGGAGPGPAPPLKPRPLAVARAYSELAAYQKRHDVNPLRGFLVPLVQVREAGWGPPASREGRGDAGHAQTPPAEGGRGRADPPLRFLLPSAPKNGGGAGAGAAPGGPGVVPRFGGVRSLLHSARPRHRLHLARSRGEGGAALIREGRGASTAAGGAGVKARGFGSVLKTARR